MKDILDWAAANPWLFIFALIILSGFVVSVLRAIRGAPIHYHCDCDNDEDDLT